MRIWRGFPTKISADNVIGMCIPANTTVHAPTSHVTTKKESCVFVNPKQDQKKKNAPKILGKKSCLASKLCFNKGLASNLQWLNSSLAWAAKRWKNKSCLAAKMFAQILAGSFVPVAGVLAVVQSERATKQ